MKELKTKRYVIYLDSYVLLLFFVYHEGTFRSFTSCTVSMIVSHLIGPFISCSVKSISEEENLKKFLVNAVSR